MRVLTIVDNFTRVSPAIDVRVRWRRWRGSLRPMGGRSASDNGLEFISKDLDLCGWLHGVELDFSWPGKPTDNAFTESFNAKFREYLNAYLVPRSGRRSVEV